jgi:hypothetical protein
MPTSTTILHPRPSALIRGLTHMSQSAESPSHSVANVSLYVAKQGHDNSPANSPQTFPQKPLTPDRLLHSMQQNATPCDIPRKASTVRHPPQSPPSAATPNPCRISSQLGCILFSTGRFQSPPVSPSPPFSASKRGSCDKMWHFATLSNSAPQAPPTTHQPPAAPPAPLKV